jgi:Glycosyltransferase family 87
MERVGADRRPGVILALNAMPISRLPDQSSDSGAGGRSMGSTLFPDMKTLLRIGGHPLVSAVLGIGLVIYCVFQTTHFHVSNAWPLAPRNDTAILLYQADLIFERAEYPARLETWPETAVYPHPPSAVLILHWLGAGGPAIFTGLWFAAMAIGLVVMLRASVSGEREELRAAWLVFAAAALVVADGPIAWDLQNGNSNLVCGGLVMGGYALASRRPAVGGALLGVAIALKLYGTLLLLWLASQRRRCAVLAAFGTVFVLAVLWPGLTWGIGGAIHVYAGWLEQLRIITAPEVTAYFTADGPGPPVVSLQRAASALTGSGPFTIASRSVVMAMWAIWLGAALWYFGRAARSGAVDVPSRAALADWTVLLLAPLPFSPWVEPYHAIALVPGAILLALVAADDRVATRDRTIAIGALIALAGTRMIDLPFALRGMVLLARFLVVTFTLGLMRRRLAGKPQGSAHRREAAEEESVSHPPHLGLRREHQPGT